MEKVDSMPLYWLANSLGKLQQDLNLPTASLASIANSAGFVDFNIKTFDAGALECPLSKAAVNDILASLHKLYENKEVDFEKELSNEDKSQLLMHIFNFQSVILRELPQLNVFYITRHRDRDMNVLINNGEAALSQKTLNALTVGPKDVVIREIREAARCLAFNISTSVGLHLSRALEFVVTKEYFPALGIKVPKNRNLGQYIKALHDNSKADPKVISKLRDFKDYYRNVITHPEEFWDIDSADSAFGTAINLIDAIMRDIEKLKKATTP